MSLALNSGTRYDEEKESNNVLIAYHADCIDGFTAAWVTYNACKRNGADTVEFIAMRYGSDNNKLSESEMKMLNGLKSDFYSKLYIVDFSISLACIGDLYVRPGLTVTILDHHKTAFERYFPNHKLTPTSYKAKTINNVSIVLANDESGASLCWNYFRPGLAMLTLIRYVKDYDLWRFGYGDATKYANKYLRDCCQTIDVWDSIAMRLEDHKCKELIIYKGMMLQREHNQRVEKIASYASFITIAGYNGLSVECAYEYTSDVGHTLAESCGTFGAMYTIDKEKLEIKWSLRSVKDMDVSHIAKQFGGGGHKNAAGFTVPMIPVLEGIKHKWKCTSPGMYDSTYECSVCGKINIEQIDNLTETKNPEYGCEGGK